ncbi:hypothetical protein [Sphingobacterium litopenaei]|uniref:Lipid A biosynthesis acyltransferase n=1 Tax=Sphingobacterium litopenaei TaxID=2763500 RepID=A0ABR7YEQ3_9SPHI|nr:hypothetical protein [Sphingobacterium litopenaei]MBD1429787.1 hypothetical protein [Sphingobacterium litopenaei]
MYALEDLKQALFSANLHYFVPDIALESHSEIYQNWKKYHGPKLNKEIRSSLINSFQNYKPGIIVLFHLGYHLQVIEYLAKKKICFDVLVSKHIKNKFENFFRTLSKDLPRNLIPNFLEAEDRTVILKIRESLKTNRHILIFADGFVSSKSAKINGSEVISLNFFSNKILVRKGIALISYYFSAPIYPIINVEIEQYIKLDFKSSITAKPEESKDQYINRSLQHLFTLLELRIKDNIEHWECWSYLHLVGAINLASLKLPSAAMTSKNDGLVKVEIDNRDFLLDKKNYIFFVIKKKNSS